MWSADDGKGLKKVIRSQLFSCSHINQVHFTFRVDNRILRLEISIDNAVRVKILD